jgi:nucleoside-diphosphate-sugar epimerase
MLSSIKVHGEAGHLSETSPRQPADPYGRSKRDGEDRVFEVGARTGMEVVVVRPPLVYGPGVRANFAALAGAVRRGVPLPLGMVRNARSLVGLPNLCDFLRTCLVHPLAAHEAFLVSDGEDLSTPDLIRRMASVLGRPARLLPVPPVVLRSFAKVVGRDDEVGRLVGSLTVDIGKARQVLGWHPPFAINEQLREALRPS